MITIKGTQPDAPFTLHISAARDAEGSLLSQEQLEGFSFSTPESDNPSAVEIVSFDAATRSGVAHFGTPNPDGSPNIANLTANVLNADGSIAAPLGEQVAIVAGDAASFEGEFAFELTEATPATEDTSVPTSDPEAEDDA